MTQSPLVFTCHGDVASCHSECSALTWKMAPIVAIWMGNIYMPVRLFRVWRNRGAHSSSFAPFFLCTISMQVLILQRVLTIVLSLGCSYNNNNNNKLSLGCSYNNNNNNNNIYLLQLGCHPVAVVILHVNKTWNWLLLNLSWEGYMRSM